MSFPAYPSYVDSSHGFHGEVPAHWEVTRLKRACNVFPSNVDKKAVDGQAVVRLCNYTDVYYNDVIHADLPFMEASATDEQIERFQLQAGDTIFTKDSETADDIARSAHVPHDLPGVVCGYHLSIARPRKGVSGAFIKRYFDADPTRAYFNVKANGLTRVGLGQYAADNAPIALPPLYEQVTIASFLDRETTKIDALVEEQRRLIELLKEKRQAVVRHLVTKGLDPTVPMQDTGTEWLCEVPAHWKVTALKRFGVFNAGAGFPHEDQGREGEELPFYKVNAIGSADGDAFLVPSEDTISKETAARLRAYIFPANSIVFAKIGAALLLGRVRQLRCEACLDNNMMGFTVCTPNEPGFFALVFSLVRFELIANPGTVPSLNERQIANVVVAVPPPSEQLEIAVEVKRLTRRLDDLAAKASEAIALLHERRAAIISAAVTGKIDVRAAATARIDAKAA